jgi:hypothetical protein
MSHVLSGVGKVMVCAQITGITRVVLIAIEGGPISKLEARELPALKQQVQFDLDTKGISVELTSADMTFDAFVREHSRASDGSQLGQPGALSQTVAVDWLLVEWVLAIELQAANHVLTILPILFGENVSNGMLDLFDTRDADGRTAIERLPAVVPVQEIAVVRKFLLDNDVQPTVELSTRTVRQTVELLTQMFLAVRMWDLCGQGSLDVHGARSVAGASAAPAATLASHAEMFEACTVQAAQAVQETLKVQTTARSVGVEPAPEPEPESAAPVVPEGLPPGSTASSSDETAFLALLRQLDVLEYAPVLIGEDIRTENDLRDMTIDELKELGFKLGSRKRVVKWSSGL